MKDSFLSTLDRYCVPYSIGDKTDNLINWIQVCRPVGRKLDEIIYFIKFITVPENEVRNEGAEEKLKKKKI